MIRRLALALAVLAFCVPAEAQEPSEFERILLPVLFQGPGARGSEWNTRISAFNSGPVFVELANAVFEGDPMCPAVCGCDRRDDVNPSETAVVCTAGLAHPAGLLIHVPRIAAATLHYHARIFDTSRSTLNAGTEIPVVRESDFRTDEIMLLDLPLDGTPAQIENNFRVALRVYNPDQIDGAQVLMQAVDLSTGDIMGDEIITLQYEEAGTEADPFPTRPSFAFLNDVDNLVRGMIPPVVTGVTSFHLRLTPVVPGTRIWAFASITNNETQLVTTVSPQH